MQYHNKNSLRYATERAETENISMSELTNHNMTATLVQVAHMYYVRDLSQQEIAETMGVSRSLIALYLKKAREQGIVRIEVFNPQNSCEDLANLIKGTSHLDRVVVVPCSHNSASLTRRANAAALARHLEATLKDGDCIGIGYGRTMAELADQLVPGRSRSVDVVSLVGETFDQLAGTYSQVNQQVQKIAGVFSGTPHYLLAPLLVETEQTRNMLMEDQAVRPVTLFWDKLTHIITSIGTLPPITGESVYVGEENIQKFLDSDGVGDIYAHYFNRKGRFIDHPIYERMISISAAQISKVEHFLLVACGIEKAEATASLLDSGLVTDLFVDENLARAMLSNLE
jgi:deoxyribonucleoside regulator